VGWAIGLKYSEASPACGRRWGAAMVVSVVLLGWAMRSLQVGTADAVWTGIGAIGTVALGIVPFKEPATLACLACLACLA
jgi:quaternary ammonium compound-resistance protein SugE